jgi:glycosyltransferase involved in cell wall biosynthesis
MRIALDLRRIGNVGIGRYMKGLVRAMAAAAPHDTLLLILPSDGKQYIEIPANADVVYAKSNYYSLREHVEIPAILRKWNADLLHAPHFVVPIYRPCPVVVTIHDVIHLVYPDDLPSTVGRIYAKGMLPLASRLADAIITDSGFSRDEITRRLRVSPEKVTVTYPGFDSSVTRVHDEERLASVRREFGLTGNFVLYTGIYRKRKNHRCLLQAVARMARQGIACDVVVVGSLHEGQRELEEMARSLGIGDRLRLPGFVPDDKLAALYSAATAYACPSLYEGFGFTILEAAACGAPVVAHRGSSLVEVGGQGVLFADATNPDDFASVLGQLVTNPCLQDEAARRGTENLARFSWENCALATRDVYTRVTGKK